MDFNLLVQDALKREVDENLQGYIEEQAKKMVKSVVESAFRSYGHISKKVEEQIQQALKINLFESGTKIEDINYFMGVVVARELHAFIQAEFGKNLQERLLAGCKISAIDEIKLSEIVEKFKEEIQEGMDDYYHEFTVHVEESNYGSIHIHFDEESDKRPYACDFCISIHKDDGKIYSFDVDKGLKSKYGFERFLFGLKANSTKIIVDDDYDTYIDLTD